ncbi:MAG: FAD-dependent oxidoreductase [Smithella sp.]|jgi:NADPH-dependent 2,4-dienoyl-CoA reductase/sulfur reductase-like enzyme/rhodanese-related sulfurtransferase
MNHPKRILIIGASACGAKAASRVKRLRPDYDVTILDQSRYISYAACGMPYYLSGKVRDMEDLLKTTYGKTRDVQYFKDLKDITIHTNVRVIHIDRKARRVDATNIITNESLSFEYDDLVLSAGASPKTPPIPGSDLKGVYHLTRMEDATAIDREIQDHERGSAVIVGGGFIGVEVTEALRLKKWNVTMLERESQLFPGMLDFEIAAIIQEHFYENSVDSELNAEILSFEGKNGSVNKVRTKKNEYRADIVIIATGLKPNTEIAQAAGLELGETRALKVNAQMQTSDPAIYAGGDLVENLHLVTGKPCYIPLGSTANKHGRVIAGNVCGIRSTFPGVQGTFICKAFDYNVGSTGITETQAKQMEIAACALSVCGFDKAHFYPDSQIMALKLILENGTNKLLGLQAVGKGDVARRIDVAATAIRLGATIQDIAYLDMAYAPPFSPALDVFITALHVAENREAGLLKPVKVMEVRELLDHEDAVLMLDVRSDLEYRRAHIDHPKVINIPLDELHHRIGELPRDKKIICTCLLGLRGFSAQRILDAAGFPDVCTLEGGLFLWPWKEEMV